MYFPSNGNICLLYPPKDNLGLQGHEMSDFRFRIISIFTYTNILFYFVYIVFPILILARLQTPQ